MSNQLGLHMSGNQVNSPQHLTRLQPPDGAGGVDAGRSCKTNKRTVKVNTRTQMMGLTK